MTLFYNFVVSVTWQFLKLVSFLSPKLSLFVKGRKQSFSIIEKGIAKEDNVIWIHAASLGEYEQGLPIMEKLKVAYPSHKILLTFFSPSGYEVRKNTKAADVVCYLPMDIERNTRKFLEIAHPELAIFIKYEIWPNYLSELKKRNIPTLLASALFKKNQVYFKSHGGFMRKALTTFTKFYVQDENSKSLLSSIGFKNVTVTGDTRFDRVHEILLRDNRLDFMADFKNDAFCFVAGSTWPEDEKVIVPFINATVSGEKFIIAPHIIKPEHIKNLQRSISKRSILFSSISGQNLADTDVLILDTIGLLTKVYSYADVAYVGGAFATGLHNTLEPAVFGVPVIIGSKYDGFIEAKKLVELGGIIPVSNEWEFSDSLKSFSLNKELRLKTGEINSEFIIQNKGASIQIMEDIRTLL